MLNTQSGPLRCHRPDILPACFRHILGTFPTDSGRCVHLVSSPNTDDAVAKIATTQENIVALRGQARQQVIMSYIYGTKLYPPVLAASRNYLVTPYYRTGSIAEIAQADQESKVLGHVLQSLCHLFSCAALETSSKISSSQEEMTKSFMAIEARTRLFRLRHTIEHYDLAARWATAAMPQRSASHLEVITRSIDWIVSGRINRLSRELMPRRLALSAHGDLTLNNILIEDKSLTSNVIFIDTRGRWHAGLPWWDPMMDLATLIAFDCRPRRCWSGFENHAGDAWNEASLTEESLLSLCHDEPHFLDWIAYDSAWRQRIELYIAIRLLGNISSELKSARPGQERRATAALARLSEQARIIDSWR
jgi:hypothetical protein